MERLQTLLNDYTAQLIKAGYLPFTTTADPLLLWDAYIESIPKIYNYFFRERRHYDCNSCKMFIKAMAPIVFINQEGHKTTPFALNLSGELLDIYAKAFFKITTIVLSSPIVSSGYIPQNARCGCLANRDTADPAIKWYHLYSTAWIDLCKSKQNPNTFNGQVATNKKALQRFLEQNPINSLNIILEVIDDLYRGDNYKKSLKKIITLCKTYNSSDNKENFLWYAVATDPTVSAFINSAIGTLC